MKTPSNKLIGMRFARLHPAFYREVRKWVRKENRKRLASLEKGWKPLTKKIKQTRRTDYVTYWTFTALRKYHPRRWNVVKKQVIREEI